MGRNVIVPTGVKSVQRGIVGISASAASGTATVTAVDTTKSYVVSGEWTMSRNGGTPDIRDYLPQLVLTNSTTVTANVASGAADAITMPYQVVENY